MFAVLDRRSLWSLVVEVQPSLKAYGICPRLGYSRLNVHANAGSFVLPGAKNMSNWQFVYVLTGFLTHSYNDSDEWHSL